MNELKQKIINAITCINNDDPRLLVIAGFINGIIYPKDNQSDCK